MCFAILGISFDKNSFKTNLFNLMALNDITISLFKHFHNFLAELIILPGQEVDFYLCLYCLTGFE